MLAPDPVPLHPEPWGELLVPVRGQFSLAGALIEDRIQPVLSARTASGKTKVDPPS